MLLRCWNHFKTTALGHRALHIVRALLVHTSLASVRIVQIPFGDFLRQAIAVHRNHGHPDPIRPVLGVLPAVKTAKPLDPSEVKAGTKRKRDTPEGVKCYDPKDVAAMLLQAVTRRSLVRNWWAVDQRGFYCSICGKVQLPPHQRVLYQRCVSEEGNTVGFCVTCGEARRNKRSNQFRRVRGGGRQPNRDKACRTNLWSRFCEATPLSSFNLIGFAIIIDKRMYHACTRCASAVVVNPQSWTHGEYFLCPQCCHSDTRNVSGPRCLKCKRSGIADRTTLAVHPWARTPITYLGCSVNGSVRKLQEGFICDDRK